MNRDALEKRQRQEELERRAETATPSPFDLFYRNSLPQNLEAERSILGAVLIENKIIEQVLELMKVEDFFLDSHRRILRAMIKLWQENKTIDLITIGEELRRVGEFEQVGGATYISSLIDLVPRTDNIEPYAIIVKPKARLRELITACYQTISKAFDGEEEPAQIIEEHERRVFTIGEDNAAQQGFHSIGELTLQEVTHLESISKRSELITGVPSGFTDVDMMTAGWQKQELIIVAARPSMGKTAIAIDMALYAAKHDYTVGIFSLEMSEKSLTRRILSSEGRVDAHRLKTAYLNKEEWGRLADATGRVANRKLFIYDKAGIGVDTMRPMSRRLKAEHNLDLLIIDYMQLMAHRGKLQSREQEVSQISRDLKGLAKELDIPVIALSQLSRQTENRSNHRPQLADLRESGSIEQDADVVCFIYRDEVYNPTDENRGEAEFIIGKQRNGGIGTVKLAFLKEFTRFENMWHE